MKKLVLFIVVIVAVSFVSCGKKQAEAPAAEPATEEVVAADTTAPAADTTATATEAAPAEAAPVAE
jgi:hypothetical protein